MSVKVSKNKKQNFIIEIKNTNAIVPPPKIEHQDIRSGLVLDIKSLENLAIEYYQKGWIISTEN